MPYLVPARPARRRPALVRSAVEQLEHRTLLTVFTVTTTADEGPGSLRQAILDANAATTSDTIAFNIPGPGAVHTIFARSPLPAVTGITTIDGSTEPGYAGAPLIELEGSGAGAAADGLVLRSSVTVRALVINSFGRHGVVAESGSSRVESSYIGTDPTGTADAGNGGAGVAVYASNVQVGGARAAGGGLGQGNVISGNRLAGVWITKGTFVPDGVVVAGNYIGTNAAGNSALGNDGEGVLVEEAGSTVIGQVSPANSGNLISGNGASGVRVRPAAAPATSIASNFIGTDAAGNIDLGNGGNGIAVDGTAGGAAVVLGNLVSGNAGDGIRFTNVKAVAYPESSIAGNFIGTDATGTRRIANVGDGIELNASRGAYVGATSTEPPRPGLNRNGRNVIAGNVGHGVYITGGPPGEGHRVYGNFIGVNAEGNAALGNGGSGVYVDTPGAHEIGRLSGGNTISANAGNGVTLAEGASGVDVDGNNIGTSPAGTILPGVDLGNAGHGVAVLNSQGNRIGTGGPANTIAANGGSGVYVQGAAAQYNSIAWNSIFSNGKLGIDLAPAPGAEGVTPNDPLDADAGPNFLQNFPIVTSATTSAGGTTVRFTLNSEPSQRFILLFYYSPAPDPSGYGEGAHSFGGVIPVTTDASGEASGVFETQGVVPAGSFVTATAAVVYGTMSSTSEFSPPVQVIALVGPAVLRRQVFFNNSTFDGNDPAPNAADDAAIVTANGMHPLRPGSTNFDFGNYTTYTRGINGVMIDVLGLPAGAESSLGPEDFTFRTTNEREGSAWRPAPPPRSVTVRRGAGVGGSDRVTLIWDDYQPGGTSPSMAVANGWLEVTVKANADTGLAQPDRFAFGNLMGDTGDGRVNALDLATVKRLFSANVALYSTADFNHDGRINALDLAVVKQNLGRFLVFPVLENPPATLATARGTATDWLPA